MADDLSRPDPWPPTTVVIRGGVGGADALRDTLRRDGSWSVISQPGLRFEVLASSVRNNQIRRTTAGAVMELGGSLIADRSGDAPPYHCHLSGLTPEQLDSILEPPERNPVPVHRRWMPR